MAKITKKRDPLKGAKLLVVDDDAGILELLAHMLSTAGYKVDTAATGLAANELIDKRVYDLLVVDKNLPDTTGLDVIKRAQNKHRETEAILITGYASYESAIKALQLGVFDYLEKPFEDIRIVKQKVRQALEKSQLRQENKVLADHLRKASQDLRQTQRELDLYVDTGVDKNTSKIDKYAEETMSKASWETTGEKDEIQNKINSVVGYLLNLRRALDELGEYIDDPPPVFKKLDGLARDAWQLLSPE